jgi:signal transduction histidine kinase
MMKPCAKQSGFNIELNLEQNLPPVNFDPDVISQVLINLIDNALKYASNADKKTIIVKTFSKNQRLFIEVRDFGPGIPKTQRKKIFDEFYRIHDESTRKTTGTGLGLALVNKFAQAHKGFAEFIAPKNNGSIFRINIPVA